MTAPRGTNTARSSAPTVNMASDEADMWFSLLPKPVREYLLVDSPILYGPQQVYGLCQQYGAARTLAILKDANRKETERAYPGLLR